MIPRLDIQFPVSRQWQYWFGRSYTPAPNEFLLNHARSGIVMALRAALPHGGRVGVLAYNCHTIANAVVSAGCTPIFIDVSSDLHLSSIGLSSLQLDAIILTNLFGIRNDVASIRSACPHALIIIDNAHGFGLPPEGDFTVYSINQGKFPALGEGGILYVSNAQYLSSIRAQYASLPTYGLLAQCKLFGTMLFKALAYLPPLYGFTQRVKTHRSCAADHTPVRLRKMAPGIRRLYAAWLPSAEASIAQQHQQAEALISALLWDDKVLRALYGENAFMLVLCCREPNRLQRAYAQCGIEADTHFRNAIRWAREFGYVPGSCPQAEYFAAHLLMVPTYRPLSFHS